MLLAVEDPPDRPAFSIRDYVFTTRNSHLENNWPFSLPHFPTSTHEIKDLLPPFQPPNSIRTHLLHSNISSKHHSNNKPQPPNSRIIIKSSATAVPDSMASKLCPVCKIFSSSSNTTLNAHIDQCLAIPSSSTWVTNVRKVTQCSVKPTKKRLMVDIYATAPRCTLEELDRRNGSNWAAVDETTRQRSSQLDHTTCTNHENPVYVDSNGVKIRIISKSLPTVVEEKQADLAKDGKASKAPSFDDAEKHCQPKYKRPKSKLRNLWSLESDKIGMSRTQGIKPGMENGHDKEESASQPFKSRNEVNCSNLETLTHWVCLKRTSRSKRTSGKVNQLDLGLSSSKSTNKATQALVERNERSCGEFSFGESCIVSSPSENASSFPNIRYAKSPLYESQVDSHNRHENNPFSRNRTSSQRGEWGESLLTFPEPLEAFGTCPSEGVQLDGVATDNSDIFLKKSVSSTECAVKSSIADFVSKLNGQKSALRKPRMRRHTKMDRQLSTKIVNVDSAENSPEMGETCNFERWSDKRKHASVGVDVLNTPVHTTDASHGRQRWDLDVGAAMKSQPGGISSYDCQWRSCRGDPAAPGSNMILLTQDRNMAVDGDSSTSPISAISTLSHPTVQRCTSQLSETESFVKPCEDPGGSIMNTWRSERHNFNDESCEGATSISPSEESVKLKDDQPCSCFMRWASSFDAFPTNQDTQVLKQGITKAKMTYTSTSIGSLSPVSRMSDMEHSSPDVLHNREAQDAQSVLRLMGKNLVVVNKDVQLSAESCFADSSTKHPESAGVSSQGLYNPRQHINSNLTCEAELSSRMKSYFSQPSPAGMSSYPFHPFPFPTIWGDTLRGGQVTFQNSFASYYSPTLP